MPFKGDNQNSIIFNFKLVLIVYAASYNIQTYAVININLLKAVSEPITS